jgi:alpha-beta hydrolase superfamily lysophospholipase
LIDVAIPGEPEGVVVLLHGGASRRANMRVSPTQLSVLRMIPIAHRVARAGQGRLAVFRLLNSRRGWDTSHTPVHDARWALAQIVERFGRQLPTCLVGHSLGGRAAILAAPSPGVVSVAALAPWVYANDVPRGLDGQRILIVHGSEDRVASPERAAALARRLMERTEVTYVTVEGGRHAMLGRHESFDGLAAEFAAESLLGAGSVRRPERLSALRAGEAWISM